MHSDLIQRMLKLLRPNPVMSLWPHVPPIYTVSSTLHIVNNTWFLCYFPLTELLFLICWHVYRLEAFPYLRHNLDHLWFLFSLPFLTALCPSFNLLSRLALHFPREFYLLFSDWLFHLIILHLIHLIWYDLINLIIQIYLTAFKITITIVIGHRKPENIGYWICEGETMFLANLPKP